MDRSWSVGLCLTPSSVLTSASAEIQAGRNYKVTFLMIILVLGEKRTGWRKERKQGRLINVTPFA